MLGQTLVFFLVAFEMFLGTPLQSAVYPLLVAMVMPVTGIEHKEVAVVVQHLRVNGVEGAATKRQVVDGIKQIGLTLSVLPDETIHLRREVKGGLPDVLIVDDG